MDKEKARRITRIIVWGTVLIWIAWDVYVFVKFGGYPTESREIQDAAYNFGTAPLAFGILGGHWFWNAPIGKAVSRHKALIALALVGLTADVTMHFLGLMYPWWTVAALPPVGYPLGRFLWPQERKLLRPK